MSVASHLTRLTGLWPPFRAFSGSSPAARVPLETALNLYLRADPGISALAGSRVSEGRVPQRAKDAGPALAFRVVSRTDVWNLDGHAGQVRARVQLSAVAGDGPGAEALYFAARAAITRLKPQQDMQGVTISGATLDQVGAESDTAPEGSDSNRGLYRGDCFVTYYESLG